MGYVTENTLASFEHAISLGVDMIELDVHRCASGEIVVFHDDTVDRLTDGVGKITAIKLPDLQMLSVDGQYTIPTLAEVLHYINKRCRLNIELKGTGLAEDVAAMVEHFVKREGWQFEDFVLSAFNYKQLVHLKQLSPYVPLAGIVNEEVPEHFWKHMRDLQAYSIHPNIAMLSHELVEKAHEEGFQVYTWTCNHIDEIAEATQFGVDGIFSDYPDRI